MNSISNLFWNSMNGIVLAILSFIFTPVYSRLVGVENYGLINVWMISLVVASVFDFGINLTINNIISDNSIEKSEKNKGFLYLEKKIIFRILIFFSFSVFSLGILYLNDFISYEYFLISIFITLSAFMQLVFQFYVNVYLGLQLHKKINFLNITLNCSKYIIGFILLYFFNNLLYFFIFQVILSLFQFFFLRSLTRSHLGISKNFILLKHDYKLNNELKRFTKNLTILSFASIILGHLDRIWALIIDDLEFYGYYAIAFTGASCLQLIIQPFYKTYFSKYSSYCKSNYDELLILFHSSSIICNGALTIISVNLFIYSEFLLRLWLVDLYTDNILLNFLLIITGLTLSGYFWLPAAFMQSQKKPEFHNKMIIYSIFFSFLLLVISNFLNLFNSPAIVWIVHGLILFVFESIHLHNKYRGFKLISWLLNGIFIPFIMALVISYSISLIEFDSAILNIFQIVISILITIITFLYSSNKNLNLKNAF